MKKLLFILILFLIKHISFCQDLRIYHGENSESVFLKKNDKLENSSKQNVKIVRQVNGIVTINILNPNPFFYNYEIKTEDIEIKDEYSNQFAELVTLINSLPDLANPGTNIFSQRIIPLAATSFDIYQNYITQLDKDIKEAKKYIKISDQPETAEEAMKRIINDKGYGFRAAIFNIKSIPSDIARFNSESLEKDLNDILEKADADGSFVASLGLGANPTLKSLYKSAFMSLNKQLVSIVKDILKITEKARIIRFQVPVKENKQTNIKLIITKIKEDAKATREVINQEIATVFPLYVRKRFEVVPVVNLIFQSNRQKFSLENNLVVSKPDDDAMFNIGAMALMNFADFGENKEYGVGIGVGYSIEPGGRASSFFTVPSLSYKSIFRLGFGFGYNLAPVGLKNGATIGSPLPGNISNIDDVVNYKRKPAAFLTIAISGLKF
ncbi:hypothetical protein [Flexithrix dorotheae]|uniref:hypothetical protein n=1 Tax=Flexithrix dorotheae TaxID=70993 RepID=UPI00036ECFC3|nr:hypothetical protein [Flexithrix dorotheae]